MIGYHRLPDIFLLDLIHSDDHKTGMIGNRVSYCIIVLCKNIALSNETYLQRNSTKFDIQNPRIVILIYHC